MEAYSDIRKVNRNKLEPIGVGGQGRLDTAVHKGSPIIIKEYKIDNDPLYDDIIAKREASVTIVANNDYYIVNLVGKFRNDGQASTSIVIDFAYNLNLRVLINNAGNILSDELKHRLCLHDCDIVHEDLNPENILLDFGNQAKICDFGHSNHVNDCYEASSGTYVYKSPEKKEATMSIPTYEYDRLKSDIFSLGIIIKEIYNASNETEMHSMISFNTVSCLVEL
uniref:Protein kinase domain-containing protein n=1 Tax=Physcomitrium patens TaxID=3218 RepID=A0A2K1JG97_PHYPA|nr:hypothetical protein PHYPA_017976 [Physcomitrium patens]